MKKFLALFLFSSLIFSSKVYAQNTATVTGVLNFGNWPYTYIYATLNIPGGGNPVYFSGGNVPRTVYFLVDKNSNVTGTIPRNDKFSPLGTTWTITACPMISQPSCQSFQQTSVIASTFNVGNYVTPLIQQTYVKYPSPLVSSAAQFNSTTYQQGQINFSLVPESNGNFLGSFSVLQQIGSSSYNILPIDLSATPSGNAGGDLCGTYPNPTVCKINGGGVPNSAAYLASNSLGQIVVAATPTATGTAGGDLLGTYPNPTVKQLSGGTGNSGVGAVGAGWPDGSAFTVRAIAAISATSDIAYNADFTMPTGATIISGYGFHLTVPPGVNLPTLYVINPSYVSLGSGATVTTYVMLEDSRARMHYGTNNATVADGGSFTGNWFLNQSSGTDPSKLNGNLSLPSITPTVYTVSTLPSAASVANGTIVIVSDALGSGLCTGSGSFTTEAVSNGTNWYCGANPIGPNPAVASPLVTTGTNVTSATCNATYGCNFVRGEFTVVVGAGFTTGTLFTYRPSLTAQSNQPFCIVSQNGNASIGGLGWSASTTVLTITANTLVASSTIVVDYSCQF